MKTCVIFNPAAKGNKARRFLAQLDAFGAATTLKKTTGPQDARRLAAEAVAEGFENIVATGGDGTVNEVINGIADAGAFDRVRLGVLPLGTVNVFARELKIPLNVAGAWELIQHGNETKIDLGWADFSVNGHQSTPSPRPSGERDGVRGNELETKSLLTPALSSLGGGEGEKNGHTSTSARSQRRYFAQLAGAGIDARAIELVDWQHKKAVGPLAYIIAGLRALATRQPGITVEADGKKTSGELALIGNGRFYGGSFAIFPGADLRDGLLEVCLFPRVNLWQIARCCVPMLFTGRLPEGAVRRVRAAQFTMTAGPADADAKPVSVEMDGEWIAPTPATFGVTREKLRVIVP
jgi:diacylglycerol kinase family enzyme